MTPRTKREDSRKTILDAAFRCFSENGYNGTSMDDIVRESGLSKGTLYWHFENKQALFMAVFDRFIKEMMGPFEEVMAMDGSASERLRAIGGVSSLALEESEGLMTIPLNFLFEIWQDEGFVNHYMGIMQQFATFTENLLEEGIASGEFRPVNVSEAAWGFMALIDGIMLYHMSGAPGDFLQQLQTMTDIFISGLEARD